MRPKLRSDIELLKEGRNLIAHLMKRKRVDKTYLKKCLIEFRYCKKKLIDNNKEEEIKEIIPNSIFEIMDDENRIQDF